MSPSTRTRGASAPLYADLIPVVRAAGWQYQTTIVWNEQNVSRRTAWGSWCSASAPAVTAPVEMIAVFFKGSWRRDPQGRTSDLERAEFLRWTLGIWTFPGENPRQIGHPAPFPPELPRRLIKLYSFPGDCVLDPFCGSGTTCLVAKRLRRCAVGVDVDPVYCAQAAGRCAQQELPLG